MTATFARFGNDLHEGRRTVPIVTRRRSWYLFSLVLIVLLAVFSVVRGPNFGIEFTGGSEFQVAGVSDTEQTSARDVVRDHLPENEPKITVLGQDTLRVQTEQLDSGEDGRGRRGPRGGLRGLLRRGNLELLYRPGVERRRHPEDAARRDRVPGSRRRDDGAVLP